MRRLAIAGLLALSACASEGRFSVADAAMQDAQASCNAQRKAGGMTRFRFVKCYDDAWRAWGRSVGPHLIDIIEETSAKNEVIAAEFDAGKLSDQEATALLGANMATSGRMMTERGQALKASHTTCQSFGSTTTCY